MEAMIEKCIEGGYFKAETNSEQIAYEMYSVYMGHGMIKNLLGATEADTRFDSSIQGIMGRLKR